MTALLSPPAKIQFFDDDGTPLAGGKLYTYLTGTTTPQAVYQDRSGTVPHANPVVLDSRGEAAIYLEPGVVYRWVLKSAAGVTINGYPRDGVSADAGDAEAVGFTDPMGPQTAAYLKTVSDMLQGQPVPLTRFIKTSELADIRAQSSDYDASDDINAAFDEYKNFILPAGRYSLGSTLLLPDGITIRGDGWCSGYNGSVGSPSGSVFRLLDAADCDMFRQAAKATRYSMHLAGFALDGNGTAQTSAPTADATYGLYQFNRNAFFLEALYNAVFEDLFWFNLRGGGMMIHGDPTAGCTNIFLKHCHGYNARTYNIYTEGAVTDLRIFGGDYGFGRVANARLTSSNTLNDVVFWTSQCQDASDANTHLNGAGAVVNGGVIIAGNNNKIIGGRIEGNAGHGIKCVGDNNKAEGTVLYFNSATASTSGLFDGINDSGEGNNWSNIEVRQSTSSTNALRKAIKLESGHANTRIRGGDLTRIGASAVEVKTPVQGFSFASGDKSDFSWASGEVKAYSAVGNSIGTTATKVQFRTETTDARSEWSTTNDDFTAAEAGIYRIDTGVNIANVTDGNSFIVAVYKNGTEYRRLGQQRAGAGAAVQIVGGLEMKLEAGDVIDIRGTCGTASTTNVGAAITWIEITQV